MIKIVKYQGEFQVFAPDTLWAERYFTGCLVDAQQTAQAMAIANRCEVAPCRYKRCACPMCCDDTLTQLGF
jgi:hypothetical protein